MLLIALRPFLKFKSENMHAQLKHFLPGSLTCFFSLCVFFLYFPVSSQNLTYGTVVHESDADEGYTLFTPIAHLKTYLIDPCGRVVNRWESNFISGLTAYLHTDGSLYRSCRIPNTSMNLTGMGGRMEKYDWSGNLIWHYRLSDSLYVAHHDFCVLPNGNIILTVAEKKSRQEALAVGRDSVAFPAGNAFILPEYLIELEPLGSDSARIVWEWHVWDHLIQHTDPSKPNYGDPQLHPERVDINFTDFTDLSDWLHINSVRYNPELDQLIVSNRHISEVWIIDHSTTTAEAATSFGGTSGKGGDLLFRWGNPQATGAGGSADQQFELQHNAVWIGNDAFSVYNNSPFRGYSSVDVVPLLRDSAGSYVQSNGYFLPLTASDSLSLSATLSSGRLSAAQKLDNNHWLVSSGVQGYITEIDSNHNIIWQYRNPISPNGVATQGTTSLSGIFSMFNSTRYPKSFSGFLGKNMTAGEPLELSYDLSNCPVTDVSDQAASELFVFPNPFSRFVRVAGYYPIQQLRLYNVLGELVASSDVSELLDLADLKSGIYFLYINNRRAHKLIKQ